MIGKKKFLGNLAYPIYRKILFNDEEIQKFATELTRLSRKLLFAKLNFQNIDFFTPI